MERLGVHGRRRAAYSLRLSRAVASWLRARRSRYHGNLWWRNRADFARHGAVVGGAGRALCWAVGGRRLARAGGLPCVLLRQRAGGGRRLGSYLRRAVA